MDEQDGLVFQFSFQGACFKCDEDGESKATMSMPNTELAKFHELTKLTKRRLIAVVTLAADQGQ